jgi:uncharacterized protein YidB (DUF937 family)
MTISSIQSSTTVGLTAASWTQHRQAPAMTNTAALLGISTGQLSSDLQSGQTLSSLASSAGVSSSDLLSSVETDLQANAPSGAPALSSTQLQNMATDIINGTGPSQSAGSSATSTGNLSALADAAGVDPSELMAQIQSGDDLSQLLGSSSQSNYGSTVASTINGGVLYNGYA